MKKILIIISVIAITFSSCKRIDFGDTNVDPTATYEKDVNALFRGASISYATASGRVGYSNATLYAQYQSQTIYTQEQRYMHYTGSWYSNYVNQLASFKQIIDTHDDPQGGQNENLRGMAEVMSILIWKRTTDTYGDIPYSEALQGEENLTPKFDHQLDIYIDLLARAKAARDLMDPNALYVPDADTDIFYKGDMDKWKKLANSVILSLSLQLSKCSASAAGQTAFQEAVNSGVGFIESVEEDLVFTPYTIGFINNPIASSRPGDFKLTKEFTQALRGTNPETWGPALTDDKNITSNHEVDLRLAAYASSPTREGLPFGYGSYPRSMRRAATSMGSKYKKSSAPFTLFSSAYTWLNRAEGSVIYASGENTADMLTNGIKTSFLAAGRSEAEGLTHAAVRVADAGTVAGGWNQVIGEEKWFALFPNGFAAWAEQRRTGYPALHPAPEATNGRVIPHRMLYPLNSKQVNESNWKDGVSTLRPAVDENTSKIPWEL